MAWSMAIGSAHDIKFRNEDEQLILGMMSPELVSGTRKRHQQTLVNRHDDLDDDDLCGDLGSTSEKKRRLTIEQVKYLEMSFNMDLKLEPERKALIAKQLGLRPRQVAIWFQNRRARWKNKQLEQDYEALKVKFDAVLKQKESMFTKHEAIMEENKNLQEEVARLRALLQNGENNLTPDAITIPTSTIEKPSPDVESDSESKDQSGKSELASPTKSSSDDQSEMQDSGHSYQVFERGAIASVDESPIAELDSYNIVVKVEPNDQHMDQHALISPDEMFGNYINPLQYPHLYYVDELFPNLEDHQMHGITWVG